MVYAVHFSSIFSFFLSLVLAKRKAIKYNSQVSYLCCVLLIENVDNQPIYCIKQN